MMEFFRGKKIFITGHTGFKGSWLCKMLINAGADVSGYSLLPEDKENLFSISENEKYMTSNIGDIRDFDNLETVFNDFNPEIVIHLAAQPLVRESYQRPKYTYETNVMGTVNILECIRKSNSVKSVVNVTTDKVYKNNEWVWGYRETDELNGYDPYSNSKSCSELVTSSYKKSFFGKKEISISTARAGNVIGGGDFAKDRIIPDCVRAALSKTSIKVRNPFSIRPYQHVLEPLYSYLLIAERQYKDINYSGSYNIGPNDTDCVNTGELVSRFCDKWEKIIGIPQNWVDMSEDGPHEAQFLKLDATRFRTTFGKRPLWNIAESLEKTIEWVNCYYFTKQNISEFMGDQIKEYAGEFECLNR